ncbi:MAG: helix-turn-helix domain-containing protein [Clostridiales bacterium]|nr:helix-turn-helix domain-containing protein [Clostridiales bacterium]
MNQYVTGAMIRELRERHHMTQAELAEKLCVCDKTVSKWETGKGYPDISLLEPIASVFGISVAELLSGNAVQNINISANMMRSKFYVCPVCVNVLHSMGEAVIHCHGVSLTPAQAEETDEHHKIFIEGVEDEYFVRIEHEMTKAHFISFAAALSPDRIQMVKLYPEGNAEARFQMRGVKQIFFYCNRDGLFSVRVHPAIDGRPGAYDDSPERRTLEQTAKRLFG